MQTIIDEVFFMSKKHTAAPLSVSQNYITSPALIRRLLSRTTITKNDHVVEIGPGKGHITRALLACCGHVTAVELDTQLYARLRDQWPQEPRLTLRNQDFLTWPLPKGLYKMFANIPFNHTTAIIRKLTQATNPPQEMWLVMEKGAAKRFLGRPGESQVSLVIKPFYRVHIAYHFRREDFHPAPGVDVVLVHFHKKAHSDIAPGQLQAYERFIAQGLQRGVHATAKQMGMAQRTAQQMLADANSGFTSDDQLYVQWLCLFRCGIH